jgi:hypothetical protein
MEMDVGEQDHDTLAWEQEGLVIDLTETPPPVRWNENYHQYTK